MTLEMSETRANLRRLYVDSGAAENGANGTPQKPFRDVATALAECNPTPEGYDPQTDFPTILGTLKELNLAGVFGDIVADRSAAITGQAMVASLAATDVPLLTVSVFSLRTITLDNCRAWFNGVGDLEGTLDDCEYIMLNGCDVGELTLTGNGTIRFINCRVSEAITIPEGWTASAFNSCFAGVTGTISLTNSDDGNGS